MLHNKVAVITGGASGIGQAAARLFVKQKAKVVLGDVQVARAEVLASELGEQNAVAVKCDVTKEADIEGLVKTAVNEFGRVDVMCNNAGISGRLGREALMENEEQEDFDHVLQVNLRSAMLGTKHAARAMKASNTRGCIINTASIAGFRVNLAPAGTPVYVPAAYTAAKHALIGLTKLGACELAPYGIRVNAVAPGITATPLVGPFITGTPDATQEDIERILAESSVLKGIPLLPEDIANAMLFLASDMARNVNAHVLVIDQGVTAGVSGQVPALAAA